MDKELQTKLQKTTKNLVSANLDSVSIRWGILDFLARWERPDSAKYAKMADEITKHTSQNDRNIAMNCYVY